MYGDKFLVGFEAWRHFLSQCCYQTWNSTFRCHFLTFPASFEYFGATPLVTIKLMMWIQNHHFKEDGTLSNQQLSMNQSLEEVVKHLPGLLGSPQLSQNGRELIELWSNSMRKIKWVRMPHCDGARGKWNLKKLTWKQSQLTESFEVLLPPWTICFKFFKWTRIDQLLVIQMCPKIVSGCGNVMVQEENGI